ncbi:MAG: RNA-binding S4 domain-containing protein [Ideonella sp.]|nr:RNA-binding S4 domain-containing protein [Ideonella sp.]MCC7456744.1 RNA-binding S4 domain-containing protein [Nitrospira sp.]
MNNALRLDKWLWAARLYKTRTLAAHAVALGRVAVNGQAAKASRELHVGDRIGIQQAGYRQEIDVLLLIAQRGGATLARTMYAETAESVAAREAALQRRRLAPEPAAGLEQGRPTKRDRRELAAWQRWSAQADD